LLAYLEANPWDAAALIWTLNLDGHIPIYAIQPQGAFAKEGYQRLQQFLKEQLEEGVERVSVPGIIVGNSKLMSGQIVPAIRPELRGMYSWNKKALIESIVKAPAKSANNAEQETYARKVQSISNYLERIYHEFRNLGFTSQERAINYAATNAFNVAKVFESALKAELEFDTIETERSPISRPLSDCWDVKLTFFDPENVLRSRKVYRFTVNTIDICPVMTEGVRSWSVR
jgi:cyanobactin maturation PatA/PatG family protease